MPFRPVRATCPANLILLDLIILINMSTKIKSELTPYEFLWSCIHNYERDTMKFLKLW
jgi:hypothetical protein